MVLESIFAKFRGPLKKIVYQDKGMICGINKDKNHMMGKPAGSKGMLKWDKVPLCPNKLGYKYKLDPDDPDDNKRILKCAFNKCMNTDSRLNKILHQAKKDRYICGKHADGKYL